MFPVKKKKCWSSFLFFDETGFGEGVFLINQQEVFINNILIK
jgi:hypothetical protein